MKLRKVEFVMKLEIKRIRGGRRAGQFPQFPLGERP